MDVQAVLVATQAHLDRAHEQAQAVVLPTSEDPTAAADLRRTRVDLEHVNAYLSGARVLADELSAGARGGHWAGQRGEVELLGRQCVMVEEMSAVAGRHLRQAWRALGESAPPDFVTKSDVAQHALSQVVAEARAAARASHELISDQSPGGADRAVQRMRSAQRELDDRAPHRVGVRR